MSNFNILYIGSLPTRIKEHLVSSLPIGFQLDFFEDRGSSEERLDSLRQAHFLLGFPRHLSSEEIQAAKNLKLVQLLSAGYDYFDVELATELDIPVANNGGANSIAVAEHTLLLILALYKKLCKFSSRLKKGHWIQANEHVYLFELTNKIVGIIGFGNIGQALAKRLKGFETTIYYHDIRRFHEVEQDSGVQYLPLDELLRRSDIVSLHVPLLQTTRNLIGKRELELMKKSALLINTSRGPIVDEEALCWALKNKNIAAAGLDVFLGENKIRFQKEAYKSPLFALENVIVTPHYAGHTFDTYFRRIEMGYNNVLRVAQGLHPKYVINQKILIK